MSIVTATYILIGMFAVAGFLSLYVALSNAEWFFRSPGVRMLAGGLRRPVARAVYAVLGAAILAMSGYMYLNV